MKKLLFVPFNEDDFLPGNTGISYLNEILWQIIETMNYTTMKHNAETLSPDMQKKTEEILNKADNPSRCAKCHNPFLHYHKGVGIGGKLYHTGCAQKVKLEKCPAWSAPEGFYSKDNDGGMHLSPMDQFQKVRTGWEEKKKFLLELDEMAFAGCRDAILDTVDSLISSSIQEERKRLRIKVGDMKHTQPESDSAKGYNRALVDLLEVLSYM